MLGLALDASDPVLATAQLRHCLIGVVIGFAVPAVVLAVSGLAGGQVPVNAIGWFSFVFPVAALATPRVRRTVAIVRPAAAFS